MDRSVALDETPGPLRLVALGADALVDPDGNARDTWRLDILNEMRQIERMLATLLHCVAAQLAGEPIPPVPGVYAQRWAGWVVDR